MSVDVDQLIEALNKGYFIRKRVSGIRLTRKVNGSWMDDFTETKTLKHLFGAKIGKLKIPSPIEMAIQVEPALWWAPEHLYKMMFDEYKERFEAARATFLKEFRDKKFYERFLEVSSSYNGSPSEILRSVRFLLPCFKMNIQWANDAEKELLKIYYAKAIDQKVASIITRLTTLLAKGMVGRAERVRGLEAALRLIRGIDVINYRKELVDILDRATRATVDFNRQDFPMGELLDYRQKVEGVLKTRLDILLDRAGSDISWRR